MVDANSADAKLRGEFQPFHVMQTVPFLQMQSEAHTLSGPAVNAFGNSLQI